LRRLAGELGIAERVVFAGYRSGMQAVYDSVDLVVQNSSTEGMPNVILEALLMRVPVVATDVGGTAEIVVKSLRGPIGNGDDAHIELHEAMRPGSGYSRSTRIEHHTRFDAGPSGLRSS
jgi:glycosyltransferase involved in cell wall biosynthesis